MPLSVTRATSCFIRPIRTQLPVFILLALFTTTACCGAQVTQPDTDASQPKATTASEAVTNSKAATTTPEMVEVRPIARDDEIKARLTKIMNATQWFGAPEVTVRDGVVFLKGRTTGDTFKTWAGDLAHNTRDVVAVVNHIEVNEPAWDFSVLQGQLSDLSRSLFNGLPTVVFALVVLPIAWLSSRFVSRIAHWLLPSSLSSDLLRRVAAGSIGMLVFLVAVYLVLRVSGLTQLALTLLGGTGLIGLALGIAFKDITENFLASIYLSLQKPFGVGDLVDVTGILGYVQKVTARTTILMNLEGNHVQIPNAIVFKNTIRNYTSNPNRREDFIISIGFDASIARAQEISLQVLCDHPAVLKDPEPLVLVDGLGASTVNLRIYFWIDGKQHSCLKVRSALIRLTKRGFQNANIELPAESREMVFPDGVPVRMIERQAGLTPSSPAAQVETLQLPEPQSTSSLAEGGLSSDAAEIEQQAKQSRMPEAGENLL